MVGDMIVRDLVKFIVIPAVPNSEPRNHKPETRNPKPETRNPKTLSPERQGLKARPETLNLTSLMPKPATRNAKPETVSAAAKEVLLS